ncbi:MAG: hypothetical protein LUG15_05645, partial [Oscillospiraceae bacterium]|nr:hypothetical protein [Oscillospiraceae bacterium]
VTAAQGTRRTHKTQEYVPRPNPPLLYLSPTVKMGAPLLDNPAQAARRSIKICVASAGRGNRFSRGYAA